MSKKRISDWWIVVFCVIGIMLCVLQDNKFDWSKILGKEVGTEVNNFFSGIGMQPGGTKDTKRLDLSKAYNILLEKGTNEFYKEYPIDLSFLSWVAGNYGDEVILDIAYQVYEGNLSDALWHEYTGNSLHVLWLLYCQDLSFGTYYLDNVYWKECASSDVITMDFTGDINFADDWHTMGTAAAQGNGVYDCISSEIQSELQSVDFSVINNEFVFSDRGTPLEGKTYTFRSKTENISYMNIFGADIANLANNHVYDFGPEALLDTRETLESAGIVTMGAGANLSEAKAVKYFVANGKKIAFVSATEIERFYDFTKQATETDPGVLKCLDTTIYTQVIAEAAKNSDYVIASVHWGTEGMYKYTSTQYEMAEVFVNAGADAVIGGHPHRLQGVEYIGDAPVLFSMGNFWFSTGTLYTMIARLEISTEGDMDLRLIPCLQKDTKTVMLTGEEADGFYRFMADMSTNLVIDHEGYVHNTKDGRNAELRVPENYLSGKGYGTYNGDVDLEGREIDIVGNLQ